MITFGTVLQLYIAHLKSNKQPSFVRYQQVYHQYFSGPMWADRPADAITRHDMLYFKQSHSHTPAQCSKALGLVKQAYGWASDRIDASTMQPYYTGHNPAWRINKHDYIPRERMMDISEIRTLLREAGESLTPRYHAFFITRLLTPCRITELCTMRWDAVNWETGKWFKRFTKNKRPQYVLIPRQALELLKELPRTDDCAYVFRGQYGHFLQRSSAEKVWCAFRKSAGLPADLQLLDFRRTLASYLYTEIKSDDLTAKAVLNHYDGRPVAIYTRLNYDRLAGILQQYADWIVALNEVPKPAMIAPPRRRHSDHVAAMASTPDGGLS